MSLQNKYYLSLNPEIFSKVHFLSIEPKYEGRDVNSQQKKDKSGIPFWSLTAVVIMPDGATDTEVFTMAAPRTSAEEIGELARFTEIQLLGLEGGKWTRSDSNQTSWSFQISGIEVL